MIKKQMWLAVAHEVLHMAEKKDKEETWWCVDRRSNAGDRVLLYKPLKGIICCFDILSLTERNEFCISFGMATAKVKILCTFTPPLNAKTIKKISGARNEVFIRRNFQGKSFLIENEDVFKAILSLKTK